MTHQAHPKKDRPEVVVLRLCFISVPYLPPGVASVEADIRQSARRIEVLSILAISGVTLKDRGSCEEDQGKDGHEVEKALVHSTEEVKRRRGDGQKGLSTLFPLGELLQGLNSIGMTLEHSAMLAFLAACHLWWRHF